MKSKLLIALAVVNLFLPILVMSDIATIAPQKQLTSAECAMIPECVKESIVKKAIEYGVDVERFMKVAECESSFIASKEGDIINGTTTSFGLFQIHLPAHPDVSREQALDLYYAIEWSAKHFATDPRMWTCYRKLYD